MEFDWKQLQQDKNNNESTKMFIFLGILFFSVLAYILYKNLT